ncbi:MAG: PIN domain-containing protein [Chloroflexota bacterium]
MRCTDRQQYTVVLVADIERELAGILHRTGEALPARERSSLEADLAGWLRRVRIERWPGPTMEEVESSLPTVLPVLRHINDLRPVVTALQAQPDWVISGNRDHWSADLAQRTGLRIVTPREFLRRLAPPET